MTELNVESFKAYDIRGEVPGVLDNSIAYAIGRAFSSFSTPKSVVVGHDIRLSGIEISEALIEGLRDSGVNVSFIGCCGTEEIYFSTAHYGFDGGVMVTASHNPKTHNGMKMVTSGSRPISSDSGLREIKEIVRKNSFPTSSSRGRGSLSFLKHREDYLNKLLSFRRGGYHNKNFKVLGNPGNGSAGLVLDPLKDLLDFELITINDSPDGSFPNGVPNPLLIENRESTSQAVRETGANLGVAWDGDFDRCFFFDEAGNFVEGYYLVGLFARALLKENPGETIIHDPRLIWNTLYMSESLGIPIQSKAGHAFIKEKMREENAIYAGEMSGHYYFRDFSYCDSGMIPWLILIDIMSEESAALSDLISGCVSMFPCSGEINLEVDDIVASLEKVKNRFSPSARSISLVDGISLAFEDWRFNLRGSNTESLLRLNVEARESKDIMREQTELLVSFLKENCQ
ncbi:MAG: phosphomannomutase [Pseudomonadota bacterium]|nr:phosphomannomutase [Pseudomonadota bacterium]